MAGASNLIGLAVLLLLVGVAGFVGYALYAWSAELADRGRQTMERKNVSFSRDGGLKVGVKPLGAEGYADKTQNVLVNVWNNAAFPNYKSSLGWNSTQAPDKKTGAAGGVPAPAPAPSGARSTTAQASATLATPAHRSSHQRSASPVPGGWE